LAKALLLMSFYLSAEANGNDGKIDCGAIYAGKYK
jgi:hypothetical protein